MSETTRSEGRSDAEGEAKPLAFDEQLAHLAAGYSNSQSVVRFLDTKAAAVLGAVPLLLGVLVAVFVWLEDSSQWRLALDLVKPWVTITFAALMVVSLLVAAWLTMQAAFDAIRPRDSGTTLLSVLFPVESDGFESRLSVFTHEPKRSDAVEDYRRQIVRMSQIVASKSKDVKRAISRLKQLLVLSFVALVAMLLIEAISIGVIESQQSSVPNEVSDSKAQSTPLQDRREPADG